MKAKIKVKDTGEILDFAPNSYVCGMRKGEDVELEISDVEIVAEEDYWSSFRRETAKDILCALAGNKDYLKVIGRIEPETMLATRFADELIRLLKENSNA